MYLLTSVSYGNQLYQSATQHAVQHENENPRLSELIVGIVHHLSTVLHALQLAG